MLRPYVFASLTISTRASLMWSAMRSRSPSSVSRISPPIPSRSSLSTRCDATNPKVSTPISAASLRGYGLSLRDRAPLEPRRGAAVQRRRADFAQLAATAGSAAPDSVEHLLRPIEQAVVRACEPELEVAAPRALGAQARSGPVGAPNVDERPVDDHRLEVNARAGPQGERVAEARVPRQSRQERARGRARVQDPQLDPTPSQLVEHVQDRTIGCSAGRACPHGAPAAGGRAVILDHQLLEVGGGDPDAPLRL